MKTVILFCLSVLFATTLSCSSQYNLRRAKINLEKAVGKGAVVDTAKKVVTKYIEVPAIQDKQQQITPLYPQELDALCGKYRQQYDSLLALHQQPVPPIYRTIQKKIFPNVSKDTTYKLSIAVQGKKYQYPIHLKASTIAGVSSFSIVVNGGKDIEVPFTEALNTAISIKPGRPSITWVHLVLVGVICFVGGYIFKKFER